MSGRSCAQCGCVLQMWPIDRKRRRNASGELICDRCSNGTRTHIIPKDSMVSCVHCGGISDRLTVKAGLVVCADGCSLRTVAHDGGDNEVLYHCLGGETRYLTPDGVKTLTETVGTTQMVLAGHTESTRGQWVPAEIRSFGHQPLQEVVLKRNQQIKVVRATAGHRWLVRRPDRVVTTAGLRPGHRLAQCRPERVDVGLDHDAVRRGLVFGDGTIVSRGPQTYGVISLWGEKAELAHFFSEVGAVDYPVSRDTGLTGVRFTSKMKGFDKNLPELDSPVWFLYGWLAGYFAADGSVGKSGQITISSSVYENLLHVRDIATVLGIGTYGVVSRERSGYGVEPTMLHTLCFSPSDLTPEFFLRERHRSAFRPKPDRFGWTVVSVGELGPPEEVYCAVVPHFESFTLEDNLLTGNCPFCGGGDLVGRSDGSAECRYCKQVFTVQVQPPSPAHPQTINGEPVDWPGKPGGPLTPEQEKAGLEIQLGPDQGDELEEGPPAVPGAPGAPPVPGEPAPSGLDQSFVQELLGEDPAADPTQPPKPKKSPPSLVAKDSKLYAMSETQFRAWLPNLYSLPSLSSLASGPDDEDWEEAFAYAQSRGASPSRARDFADDQPSPAYLSNEWSRWSKSDDEPEDRYASRMYMTEEGIAMPEDSFLRRLAVRFADDREAVIEDIRSSRH